MWHYNSLVGEYQLSYKFSVASDHPFIKHITFFLRRTHVCNWASISEEEHQHLALVHASFFWRTHIILSVLSVYLLPVNLLPSSAIVQGHQHNTFHAPLNSVFLQDLIIQESPRIVTQQNISIWDITKPKNGPL